MTKNISTEDVKIIMNYEKAPSSLLTKWYLREAGNTIILNGKYRNIVKIFLTPIFAIAIILYSLWDGGVKSAIEELKTPIWYIHPVVEYENHYFDSRYDRMKKILNRG